VAKNFKPAEKPASSKPERKVATLILENSSYTSTYKINVLFSLKQKKFVKPTRAKGGQLYYTIYEGVYLLISARGYNTETKTKWTVSKVRIVADTWNYGKIEVLSSAEWITPPDPQKSSVPILRDIVVPGYHGTTKVPPDKVYSDADVEQLMKGGVDPAVEKDME